MTVRCTSLEINTLVIYEMGVNLYEKNTEEWIFL